MEENFGEDPFMVQEYGVAALVGLQGVDGLGGASSYLGSPKTKVAAQAKHFAACTTMAKRQKKKKKKTIQTIPNQTKPNQTKISGERKLVGW